LKSGVRASAVGKQVWRNGVVREFTALCCQRTGLCDWLLQWRTKGGSTPPEHPPEHPTEHPPKFRSFSKSKPNSQFRGLYIRNNLIRIWVSFICKSSGTPD
jgi:hypothetical protein